MADMNRLVKIVLGGVALLGASFLPSVVSAKAESMERSLVDVDKRLAKIERAIIRGRQSPLRTVPTTGRVGAAGRMDRQIHARLTRMEAAAFGKSLPAPRAVPQTGAGNRSLIARNMAILDARVARLERVIVGRALPLPGSVSATGRARRGPDRSLASLNTRLARIETAIRRVQAKAARGSKSPPKGAPERGAIRRPPSGLKTGK